ncbi:arsenic resistance N-acetyltransferase ArsN2 [Salinirubellus salinus]|uniref:Arsenic resistance N-acetyltransferase ArsN2 n=1 Tax=Salinirubellus salinus TaxID=1364945 RepID=A0A9E7R447_9EURY|nr:arsenic resistance N-acetyltransferase ArsN2 [Salinirubellus salinus]UWM55424.1 arsenic resistance N-acetyltransferase ArsN2 [Salinirubellus salinus]
MTLELVPADGPARTTLLGFLREADLPTTGVRDGPGRFYLAVADDEAIAGGGVEPYGDAALLRSVVVRPDRRGEGVGATLVTRLLDVAGATGAGSVWLLTETAESFFAGLGFETVPREAAPAAVRDSPEFATVCDEHAACMTRALGGNV